MSIWITWCVPAVAPAAQRFTFDPTLRYPLHSIVVAFGEHASDLGARLPVHYFLQGLMFATAHPAEYSTLGKVR